MENENVDVQNFSAEKIQLIKNTIAKGATDDELQIFIMQCVRTKLDPFARQLYFMKRRVYDSAAGGYVEKMSVEMSIDGFRLTAQRTGQYCGQIGPLWCGPDGVWTDIWLGSTPPYAAKVGVCREGFKEPIFAIARFDSYAPKNKDGKLNAIWAKMPDLMVGKCAEALAIRRAFPMELSGIYTSDEMMSAGNEIKDDVPQIEDLDNVYKEITDKINNVDNVRGLLIIGNEIKSMSQSLPDEMLNELREKYGAKLAELTASTASNGGVQDA